MEKSTQLEKKPKNKPQQFTQANKVGKRKNVNEKEKGNMLIYLEQGKIKILVDVKGATFMEAEGRVFNTKEKIPLSSKPSLLNDILPELQDDALLTLHLLEKVSAIALRKDAAQSSLNTLLRYYLTNPPEHDACRCVMLKLLNIVNGISLPIAEVAIADIPDHFFNWYTKNRL